MTPTAAGTPTCSPTCGRSSTRPTRRGCTPTTSAKRSSLWTSCHGALRTAAMAVDGYYLRKHLADFVPDDAEKIAPRKWREGSVQARGYHERHFEDAFDRYLGRRLPSDAPKCDAGVADKDKHSSGTATDASAPSSHPSNVDENNNKSDAYAGTDESPSVRPRIRPRRRRRRPGTDAGRMSSEKPSSEKHKSNEASPGSGPDGMDGTDTLAPLPRAFFMRPLASHNQLLITRTRRTR